MLQQAKSEVAGTQQFSIYGAEITNSSIHENEIKQQINTMANLCVADTSSNMFKGA